jgi:hypothetical protein
MSNNDPTVQQALLRDLRERALFRRVIAGAVLLATLGVGVAFATPNKFQAGDPVSAEKLNQNFADIETRLASLETKKARITNAATGKSVSVGAAFCGVTPTPVVGSAIGGYAKAAAACQAAAGCQGAATAHMCTGDELVRSRMLGLEVPSSWYSTGASNQSFYNTTEHLLNDCYEWTSALPNQLGAQWNAGGSGGPGFAGCASPAPIACCD